MPNLAKPSKKLSPTPVVSGRFATPEEAAKAKNAQLEARVKKIGLKVIKNGANS